MEKNILKGFTMLMLLVVVTLAAAAVPANAQSPNSVKANIPFEFIVADKTLPAGAYAVTAADAARDALMIQSADGKNSALRMSGPTEQKNKRRAQMVFHRYGQNYFLAQVWNGESSGRELAKSKQERAVERELASISSKSELARSTYETIVVVAAAR